MAMTLIHDHVFQSYPSSTNLDLRLYYCGTQNCPPGHAYGPGIRDYYKIHYIHSGSGTFRAEDKSYHLTRGQGFLITPGMLAYYRADLDTPWSYSWVAFNGVQVEYHLKRSRLSAEEPIVTCDQEERIQACFMEMFNANKEGTNKELRMLGSLYTFLSIILDTDTPFADTEDLRQHRVHKMLDFIEMNYAQGISVQSIADEMNLDRKYASRLFKEGVGLTPMQYIVRYRMQKARHLLENPRLAISEVSTSVGYVDPLLFSRMFKGVVGVSPSEFRKQAAMEANATSN
jgi:AraC-like DNA-binding protein